jgi:hypothetical protein
MPESDMTHIEHDDGDDDNMDEDQYGDIEVLHEGPLSPQEAETRRRYEDANRLLAELAVARRQRWGDT